MIVGIAGHIGAGKDTLATRLIERWGFTRVGFADALKDEVGARLRKTILAILLNEPDWWTRYGAYVTHAKKTAVDPVRYALWIDRPAAVRCLLQEYGTEVRRHDDADYWTNEWHDANVAKWGRFPTWPNLVVPDLRFPNEYAWLRIYRGTKLVKVVRPGHEGDSHTSERALDSETRWDADFSNVGDIDDLWNLVDAWMGGIQRAENPTSRDSSPRQHPQPPQL